MTTPTKTTAELFTSGCTGTPMTVDKIFVSLGCYARFDPVADIFIGRNLIQEHSVFL
jgi:hypothetical protein